VYTSGESFYALANRVSAMTDDKTTRDGHHDGRDALEAWDEAKPTNAYESDLHFRRLVEVYRDPDKHANLEETLRAFGGKVAGEIDAIVRENDRLGNHPEPDRYTDYGRRIEEIDHHPTYHEAGEQIYGSGLISAYADAPNNFGALSRMYLSSYNGEAGHNCPAACTAGVVRVLQHLAGEDLREEYLPGFLSDDYEEHLEGAQFMTEIQGGSDVGKNATRAEPADDDTYRIWGEKWFCSNIDGDVFLMTARFSDEVEGTSGLGLFFVPRELSDGSVNDFEIRRLKDKIGTRTMASAECDFEGAVAYHMGPEEEGFKNMMTHVINTSRLWNAVACVGLARRSYVTAQTYARFREAFGEPIGNYPLVQETLADLKAELDAAVSGSMHLADLQDRIDAGEADDAARDFFRMALNLNKVYTAKFGRRAAVSGIEVLGGNGAIETFSVLPRLLRDSIVTENWEGTHNTLQMQIMRDMQKYGLHQGFFGYLEELLHGARQEDGPLVSEIGNRLTEAGARLGEIAQMDEGAATLAMRPLMDRLAGLMYAAIRIWERGQLDSSEKDDADRDSLVHFIETRLADGGPDRADDEYMARIEELSGRL
jgi:alkylation response protein AidB-like acyl-CoA dehydrogenase